MKKILVIQTAFLGDSLLTLKLLDSIKLLYPSSLLSILCIPKSKEIFEYSPSVDSIITYDKRKTQKGLKNFYLFLRQINAEKFDIIISPHRSLRSSLISFFADAQLTVGFDNSAFSFLYKQKIHYIKDFHEVKRNLLLLGNDEIVENWQSAVNYKFSDINFPAKIFSCFNPAEKYFAVAPGSVWETKKYPTEKFIEIINSLNKIGVTAVIIGAANEQAVANLIIRKTSRKNINLTGIISIPQTIKLLKEKISFLICNDSAPTHMGMVAEIPVLTIYCSTVPEFGFYPYNKKSASIGLDNLNCKPCGIHGYKKCPKIHFKCGNELSSETIISTLKEKFI